MISCFELFDIFLQNEITFFTGVPDSTFGQWMKFLADEHGNKLTNIIACNECEAIAIATGYHLGTGKVPMVYLQNSGLGKTVNPLTSLCDPQVYSIPLMLLIGWRGEPGVKDEPQHKKMGRITMGLLDTLEIPYKILPQDPQAAKLVIEEMKSIADARSCPVALIIRKNTLREYDAKTKIKTKYEMKREDALKVIVNSLDGSQTIVSTTGKCSRELFEYRVASGKIPADFYTVGGMGCCASIAHGIALSRPDKKVLIFDGDGAVLMQMGSLATIGYYHPENLRHIIFDNAAHESTGSQPTVSPAVNFEKIALACGYESACTVSTKIELESALQEISTGPSIIIVNVNSGSRNDLGRPTSTPVDNKLVFMKNL